MLIEVMVAEVIVAVFGVVVMIANCCGSNWDDAIDAAATDVADDAAVAAVAACTKLHDTSLIPLQVTVY